MVMQVLMMCDVVGNSGLAEDEQFYLKSEADELIAKLESALSRCVDAIDATYADTSEAYGLPLELFDAGEAAKPLVGHLSTSQLR